MRLSKLKLSILAAGVGFLALSTAVLSQVFVPVLTVFGQTDLIQVIPNGSPSAQSQYATIPSVTNVTGYYVSTPVTNFTYTFTNGVTQAVFTPAGTLALGYTTLAQTPSDGTQNCIFSSTAFTALNVCSAVTGTGQIPTTCTTSNIVGGVTSLSANATACYLYKATGVAAGTWYRMR